MGCTESRGQENIQRIKVETNNNTVEQASSGSHSPEVKRISSAVDPTEKFVEEPHLVLTDEERRVQSSLSSGSFSLNLNDSLDSRLSLSFKSQTQSACSASSYDSGVYELDDEYSHVITEHAAPALVQKVERDFVSREHLELCVLGQACARRQSAKSRDYYDEQHVLNTLRSEGLIHRPQGSSTGGVCFEVVSVEALPEHNNTIVRKLPPMKLERMEQRRKKKKLTQDTIREKLEKAEERRKRKEEEIVRKMSSARPRSAVLREAVEKFKESTKQKYVKKLETTTENREKHLQELQEKLRSKREHSAKVRLRKMLNPFALEAPIPEEET